MRSLLLWIASEGVFSPCWTERILDEVGRNLLEAGDISEAQWSGLTAALRDAFPDALVEQEAVDHAEEGMPNEPKDRHVLAAAVVGGADRVVTNNLKHFKAADLATVGKSSLSADRFLCELLDQAPLVLRQALRNAVAHITRPRQWTEADLLGRLAGLGHGDALTPTFAAAYCQRFSVTPVVPPPKED